MSDIQLAHFTWSTAPERDRRMTTTVDEPIVAPSASRAAVTAQHAGFLGRLGASRARVRLAIAGGPAAIDSCTCPA